MFILFISLSITGLCLSFADTTTAQTIVKFMGGWEMRRQIHWTSGILMVLLGLYHVVYVARDRTVTGSKKFKMVPTMDDIKDMLQYAKYLIGFGEAPKFGRFSFKEKFDYWGALWGIMLMGITGILMMFPLIATGIFPYAFVNLSRMMHSHEATIAISFIAIWHLYNVHVSPYRTKGVWLTGNILVEDLKHHHPIEYEELKRLNKIKEVKRE